MCSIEDYIDSKIEKLSCDVDVKESRITMTHAEFICFMNEARIDELNLLKRAIREGEIE